MSIEEQAEFIKRIQEIIDDLRGYTHCSYDEHLAAEIARGKEDSNLMEHVTNNSEILRFAAARRINHLFWSTSDDRQIEFWQNSF
jgi:hypothetical protein